MLVNPLLSGVDFVAALRLGSVYFDFYYSVFSSLRLELLPYARPFVVSESRVRVMPSDVLLFAALPCRFARRWVVRSLAVDFVDGFRL